MYLAGIPVINMPPKGRKGPKRTGSAGNEAGENGDPKIDSLDVSPEVTSDKEGNVSLHEDENSDDTVFNDEDSYKLLKHIIINQKVAEKKSDERYNKLSKSIKDSKKSLEGYKETNDKVVTNIKSEVCSVTEDLIKLEVQVKGLQNDLRDANDRLDTTQKLLDETREDLKEKAIIIEKHDKKYEPEEDELKRCLLLLDGVNEHGNKKPTTVVENLLKDLGIQLKDGDIKSAYRLGPLKKGVSRPRTIRMQFTTSNMKGGIFKHIGKLKGNVNWKGIHLNDALSPIEQRQMKDIR